jgi:hypothetical protein
MGPDHVLSLSDDSKETGAFFWVYDSQMIVRTRPDAWAPLSWI